MNLRHVQAEVLGKRVVVQHTPLGGLIEWKTDSIPPTHRAETQRTPLLQNVPAGDTRAPWAASSSSTSMAPPIPVTQRGTRAPWGAGNIVETSPPTFASQDDRNGRIGSRK